MSKALFWVLDTCGTHWLLVEIGLWESRKGAAQSSKWGRPAFGLCGAVGRRQASGVSSRWSWEVSLRDLDFVSRYQWWWFHSDWGAGKEAQVFAACLGRHPKRSATAELGRARMGLIAFSGGEGRKEGWFSESGGIVGVGDKWLRDDDLGVSKII